MAGFTGTQLFINTLFNADYFNNFLKCWEPFLEPCEYQFLYERGPSRGTGITFRALNPIQFVVSGAFFVSLNNILEVIKKYRVIFYSEDRSDLEYSEPVYSSSSPSRFEKRLSGVQQQQLHRVRSKRDDTEHLEAMILGSDQRVGFAIQNFTGQTLRYVQRISSGVGSSMESERNQIHYLPDGFSGYLNFAASEKVIRNRTVVEEAFSVQRDVNKKVAYKHRNNYSSLHKVSIQLCGYSWLPSVQADNVGIRLQKLTMVDKKWQKKRDDIDDLNVKNALQLVTEVIPKNGGRLLRLRSVFAVKNYTGHTLALALQPRKEKGAINVEENEIVRIEPGETYYLPLSLMTYWVKSSSRPSLGYLSFRPDSLLPINDEFDKDSEFGKLSHNGLLRVSFTENPLDVMKAVQKIQAHSEEGDTSSCFPMKCFLEKDEAKVAQSGITTYGGKLPEFFYYVEVDSGVEENTELKKAHNRNKNMLMRAALNTFGAVRDLLSTVSHVSKKKSTHREYHIAVYPPFVLENLLPFEAIFQLVHAEEKRPLWSSRIGAGQAKALHTVSLTYPVALRIKTSYCNSSTDKTSSGLLIHIPDVSASSSFGFGDDFESNKQNSINLFDCQRQIVRLQIKNIRRAAGQRHIIVYCPYWIVNYSQYPLLIREYNEVDLPAGSITTNCDGSLTLDENSGPSGPYFSRSNTLVFPGSCGSIEKLTTLNSVEGRLCELPFDQVQSIAYPFNFEKDKEGLLSLQKVQFKCPKLKQNPEGSKWSNPYSLDSLGVNQTVICSVSGTEGSSTNVIEVGMNIVTAPGRLGSYTKLVHITPRYVVVNKFKVPMKVFQSFEFGRFEEASKQIVPNVAKELVILTSIDSRKISFQIEGPGSWYRSPPVLIDKIGTEVILVKKRVSLSSIKHAAARSSDIFEIEYPLSLSELGIVFETAWRLDEPILVKRVKPGSHAETHDIQVGDALLEINDQPYVGSQFDEAMGALKNRAGNLRLKMKTIEERLRAIREGARTVTEATVDEIASESGVVYDNQPDFIALHVEIKAVNCITYAIVSEGDINESGYRIENDSPSFILQYKQKTEVPCKWTTLEPLSKVPYIWDDPCKVNKRLLLRIISNVLHPFGIEKSKAYKDIRLVTINFEKLGSNFAVPITWSDRKLEAVIESDGTTRVLRIRHKIETSNMEMLYGNHATCMYEKGLAGYLSSKGDVSTNPDDLRLKLCDLFKKEIDPIPQYNSCDSHSNFESIFGKSVSAPNQLLVQILEAKELRPSTKGKTDNVYCKIFLEDKRSSIAKIFTDKITSICENTLDPEWYDETFVFDLGNKSEEVLQNYFSIRVVVKSLGILGSKVGASGIVDSYVLGETSVKLSFVKPDDLDAEPGWFALQLKSVSTWSEIQDPLSAGSQSISAGSIKLRVCWIKERSTFDKYYFTNIQM